MKNNSPKKNILITGASSGIGKSIAEYLLSKGFFVIGTSRNPKKYSNFSFPLVELDVRDSSSISNCIANVLENYKKIDVLVNNAGVGITGPLEETPINEIKNTFQTNFFGPIEVIQQVLPSLREQKSGLIINITSIAGYMGLPFRGAYSSSKSALEIMTEAIRMETKQFNIDLVNVAPGDFATNIASGRFHVPYNENSAYKETYGKSLELMNEHVDAGSDPKEMAKAVHKIILSKNRKIHYKVGEFLQKFSIVLKFILPDLWYEKILMKFYKL